MAEAPTGHGQPPAGHDAVPAGAALHGLAGAVASALSMVLLYPLDQARVIQQTQSTASAAPPAPPGLLGHTANTLLQLLRQEGPSGLYRGVLGTLQTVGVSYFVYFFLYNRCKVLFARMQASHGRLAWLNHSSLVDLCASTAGGVLNVLLTCPLWVAAMRLKFQQQGNDTTSPTSLWKQLLIISQTEGVGALWRGTGSSLILVSNPILQFTVYDALKRARLRLPLSVRRLSGAAAANTLGPVEAALIGGAAKTLATVATYPLQVAQTLQRAAPAEDGDTVAAAAGTLSVLVRLAQVRGVHALFSGIESKLLQTVLNAALMFMFYERILAACLFLKAPSRWKKFP